MSDSATGATDLHAGGSMNSLCSSRVCVRACRRTREHAYAYTVWARVCVRGHTHARARTLLLIPRLSLVGLTSEVESFVQQRSAK